MTRFARWILMLSLWPGLALGSDEYESGQLVVNLAPGHTIDEVNATWGTTTLDAYAEGNLYLLDATDLGDIEDLADQMSDDPAIDEVEANYIQEPPETIRHMVVVMVGGGYVDFEDQSLGDRIGLDKAHLVSRGAGVTVAILDTGVDPTHEVLQYRLSPSGYDFIDGDTTPWEVTNGIDDDLDDLIDEGYGHGTMVAGITALVAPDASILPVRVLDDEGNGNAYQIAKGISYAVHHGAQVLNLSFGTDRTISIIGHQVSLARESGVVVIAGQGNQDIQEAFYPAADNDAEMVTAVDSLDTKATFADWHSKVLVSAPGVGVRSCYPGGAWAMGEGCSYATPLVAGEAALILSRYPADLPEDVQDRIEAGVVPIDQLPGNAPYGGKLGSGRIYVPDALGQAATVPAASASAASIRLVAMPNPTSGLVRLVGTAPLDAFEARVFDAAGRLVRVLARSAAPTWDGMTSDARPTARGVYFIRLIDDQDRELVSRVHVVR